MNAGRTAVAIVLALAAAACTGSPRHVGPAVTAQPDETVAPQDAGASPVGVDVSPQQFRSGTLRVVTSARASGAWLTASHVWLDSRVGERWVTAWLLASGVSISIEAYAAGGVALTSEGVTVPSTLTFVLDPVPPAGRYRLRVQVGGGAPVSEGGPAPSWATTQLDVLAA